LRHAAAGGFAGARHRHRFVWRLQLPEQQSALPEHCSPAGRQHTPVPPSLTEQVLASPNGPGQHCDGDEHGCPSPLQQTSSLPQLPTQQSPAWPGRQRPPRGAHWHIPPTQEPLQQSLGPLGHAFPLGRQQVFRRHRLELQHSLSNAQLDVSGLQQPNVPQLRPGQQLVLVQLEPELTGWQQAPPAQVLVAHCTPPSQPDPVGSAHRPLTQLPSQQSPVPEQALPSGMQAPHRAVVPRQRSVPQHSRVDEQPAPVLRQHWGAPPSGGPWHAAEAQQSLRSAQRKPVDWHELGWHRPSRQIKLWDASHSTLVVHVSPMAPGWQRPPVQRRLVQQSVSCPQVLPRWPQPE